MDIPNSLRKLMQKDHEVRVFISHILKENKLLKQRVDAIEETIRNRFYKPNKQSQPSKLGPPKGHKANHRPKPTNVDQTINLRLDRFRECHEGLNKVVALTVENGASVRATENLQKVALPYLVYLFLSNKM